MKEGLVMASTTKSRERVVTRDSVSGAFTSLYTRDADGFYIRNDKPATRTINERQVMQNLKELLRTDIEKAKRR